ncbi:hypothetical protein [Streptomyces benahoarensis]|uniref:Uncharacterized protein n=1 Tax=Streptomyces benahoarensis TaxID=2595054 RepID=A0A553ZNU3_9ACTN|nr:hypothetical protein [Streptomyces benahoarensis]TSB25710.1 hypothetical protein FNJ62_12270 [Streptomyces benahoarensis]TSB42966.1 hypothetical protein FNZ23_07055 [Streptomyces benahoarensis]
MLDAVLGPASEAYYAERVRSGSGARARAQAAQSTVTLFAGGIVAALTFTQLADRPLSTQLAGVGAVALWLFAAVLYLRAVAQPVGALAGPSHARDRLDLLNAVLKRADDEAAQVDRRQKHANRVAMGALAVSVLTVGLAAVGGPKEEKVSGAVAVSPAYAKSIRTVCAMKDERITGRIDKTSLATPFVNITVASRGCGGGTGKETELVIPKSAVRAIAWEGE